MYKNAVEAAVRLSVVIPVYRSQETLRDLHRRIVATLEPVEAAFEIVFVEDCGGDDSWQVIEKLAQSDSRVQGIKLARNYGQHNALLCGIRAARGELIVTIDDDLQNPPEEIHKLLAKLAEGHDVVYGSPQNQTHGFFRNQASRITKLALQGTMGVDSASKVSAFRAFRTRLRDAFDAYRSPSVNIDVLLTWGTTRFASVDVHQDERAVGDTGYSLKKLINHAINMMTGFSVLPLQIASFLGIFFGALGFLVLAYVVLRYLIEGSAVPGFPFLASIIAIFSGVQLFALGIFGEYLARMHFRSMERPPYSLLKQTMPTEQPDAMPNRCKAGNAGLNGRIDTPALELAWTEAPWDTVVFGYPVLQINSVEVRGPGAVADTNDFVRARDLAASGFVSCRLSHECLRESMLLEDIGFRFIEMLYQPELCDLQSSDAHEEHGLIVSLATADDLPEVLDVAGKAFRNERFHVDPRLPSKIGDLRYQNWVRSSVTHPTQRLYVLREKGLLVAFFVLENLADGTCYWHLNAVEPGVQGQGYGMRAWQTMLGRARRDGAARVRTSIVARNHRVLNLYARLGFRFPPPMMTFHWVRSE